MLITSAQLRAAGITLQVVARAEREELAYQLVKRGLAITLAPQSLVPSDLVAVPVRGMAVNRSIGLQWHAASEGELADTIAEELDDLTRSLAGVMPRDGRDDTVPLR